MLKPGIHPRIVQERLGHSSIQTTLDVYSNVVPGLQETAANRFDELINLMPKPEAVEKHRWFFLKMVNASETRGINFSFKNWWS